jgi:hypothetical protein
MKFERRYVNRTNILCYLYEVQELREFISVFLEFKDVFHVHQTCRETRNVKQIGNFSLFVLPLSYKSSRKFIDDKIFHEEVMNKGIARSY